MKIFTAIILLFTTPAFATEQDFTITEGDIAIRKIQDKSAPNFRRRKWVKGVIPYEISSYDKNNRALKTAVKRGIETLTRQTNLVFRIRTNKDKDYISFTGRHRGCFSYVGRQGGKQEVNLANGCHNTMIVAHEIFHASGIEHEQSREDRDQYIKIDWKNVASSHKHNFNKVPGARHGTYNFDSIMHYDSYSFSKNGRPTMTKKNGDTFGRNLRNLTTGDIAGINHVYPQKYTEFRLSELDIKVTPKSDNNMVIALKTGSRNLKLVKHAQYFFENSSLDSALLENKEQYFQHLFSPKLGKNKILVELTMNDNKKMEKEFTYTHLNKKMNTECTFKAKSKSKKLSVPLTFTGENVLFGEAQLKGHTAKVSTVYSFENDQVTMNLILKRKSGLFRKEQKVEKKFVFSNSNTGSVKLPKASLSCKLDMTEI